MDLSLVLVVVREGSQHDAPAHPADLAQAGGRLDVGSRIHEGGRGRDRRRVVDLRRGGGDGRLLDRRRRPAAHGPYGFVLRWPFHQHDVLERQRGAGQVRLDPQVRTPPLEDVPGGVEGRVVEVGERAAEPGVQADEGDAGVAHLVAQPCAVAAGVGRERLVVPEGVVTVHRQQDGAARLGDPPQLGQPGVLVLLVEVGEDAVVVDQVEVAVGVIERWQAAVHLEGGVRHVLLGPFDGALVDVCPVQGRLGRHVGRATA